MKVQVQWQHVFLAVLMIIIYFAIIYIIFGERDLIPLTQTPQTNCQEKVSDVSKKEKVVKYISEEYNTTEILAENIVYTVYHQTEYNDFPEAPLVLAIIAVESSFRQHVESSAGAIGLMQLMPIHDPDYGVRENISSGIGVLIAYRLKVNTNEDALHAYNVGIGAFNRGKRNPKYVKKVLDEQRKFLRF